MEINKNNIMDFINKCNLRPEKDFGQNFLIEPTMSKIIVDALNIEHDKVLEIGPGLGSLTHFINESDCELTCVDIDSRMINFLKALYGENTIIFLNQDAREIDYSKYTKIISNLPYNITTELLSTILTKSNLCKKYVFMCQKENYSHISNIEGKEYGPLSILCHLIGKVKKEAVVKAGSFYPAPQCDSVVFSIESYKIGGFCRDIELNTYYFAKKIFLNRRKTFANNLMSIVHNKDIVDNILSKFNLKLTVRPEEINPEMYLKIYIYLKETNYEN